MIVIVDYGVGNLRSIQNMLDRAGFSATISGDPDVLATASKLILPGVGHFGFAMEALRQRRLVDALNWQVLEAHVPVLGICLGAQLLGRMSEEGDCPGLNWVPMDVVAFDTSRMASDARVPHMGWAATSHTSSPLFEAMIDAPRFYYVHSFHFQCDDPGLVTCTAEHGYRFDAGFAYGNVFGVQFHPEKSHVFGRQLLGNFASMELRG